VIFVATGCASKATQRPRTDHELAVTYLSQGQKLESQGNFSAAIEQYKLALTVDPENTEAKANHNRLAQKLTQLSDERYQLGMKYHRQGKYGLARKQFLIALKYNPDHPHAPKMLVSRKPDKAPKYVFHIVEPGESLSKIAKYYYGDYRHYHVIAQFNQLDDATKVKPGQRIMIPEIEGVDLFPPSSQGDAKETEFIWHTIQPGQSISKLAQIYYGDYSLFHNIAQYNGMDDATKVTIGEKIKIPRLTGVPFYHQQSEQKKPSPPPAPAVPDAALVEPQAEPEATAESENELAVEPEAVLPDNDEHILAYRDAGITLFNQRKYEDAVFELNKAIEATPDDQTTRHYLAKAYFESGKQSYNQQDFQAAKEAFESSLQYDPQCSQCQGYIDRSKMGPLLAHRSNGMAHYNRAQYDKAITEFEQFLQKRPGDKEVRLHLSKAYFEQALIDYNKGYFGIAKKKFETSLAYNKDCEKCADYIEQSIESYKSAHYNKGIVFFGKEQLPEAIAEWEKVQDIDPEYKEVDQNLKKARALLEKLEKIRKSSQ
jgi:tetratricopeptide (TPR) repeat protein